MQVSTISIVYHDGTLSHVNKDVLDVLIATGKIKEFKRDGKWTAIGAKGTRLRDYNRHFAFKGAERRAPWPSREPS